MSITHEIKKELPSKLLQRLEEYGAKVSKCGVKILVLDETLEQGELIGEASKVFLEYLTTEFDCDPIITPSFGLNPKFVNEKTQLEVINLLFTFSSKKNLIETYNEEFNTEIPNMLPPIGMAFRFNFSLSVHRVQQEIQAPSSFICPNISNLPIGTVICDLSITFANALIVRRLRKT